MQCIAGEYGGLCYKWILSPLNGTLSQYSGNSVFPQGEFLSYSLLPAQGATCHDIHSGEQGVIAGTPVFKVQGTLL
jgi:hypothetical protein